MKRLLILAALSASFGVAQSLPYFYCADAGSTDDYACNLTPYTPAAYVTGGFYSFKANTANTGAATVNFNSLGAKTIVKVAGGITTALATNDIRVGQYIVVQYDGTNMQMQSTLGNAATSLSPAGSATTDAQCYATATTLGVCTAPIFTVNSVGTAQTLGPVIQNTTAAAAGTQQYSPCVDIRGYGWKTNATAASQQVDWCLQVVPVQGAANPTGTLSFLQSINGASYTQVFGLNSITGARATPTWFFGGDPNTGFYEPAADAITLAAGGTDGFSVDTNGFTLRGNTRMGWSSDTTSSYVAPDIAITRDAAGVLSIQANLTVAAANYRAVSISALYHKGTTYTLSTNTCSGTTLVGGATGGTFVSGTTGSCTGVVTMGNSATAPTGWKCNFGNRTSAVAASETASTTTTATFAIATVSGEVVAFTCDGF